MKQTSLRMVTLGLSIVLSLALLVGCRGTPLPDGMDEDELLAAGQQVVDLLVAGEYEQVYQLFRADIRESLTTEDIQTLCDNALSDVGSFVRIDDSRVQGSSEGETHGIAELYYDFTNDTVRFRVAFDLEMQLIGLDPPRVL